MMKMICIGPNAPTPNFFLWLRAKPSLVMKAAQNQQMLIDVVMFVALASHLSGKSDSNDRMDLAFSMQNARRKQIASPAVTTEKARIRCR